MRMSWLVGVVAVVALGCSEANEKSHEAGPGQKLSVTHRHSGALPIRVVCTTGMVADLVRAVGGERVRVTQLMGAGVDPHLYKAAPGDVAALTDAEVVFYSGLHLEGKLGELIGRMARRKPTFGVCDYLEPSAVLANPEGAYDPHVWFDISLWAKATVIVGEALALYDPTAAASYRDRAGKYADELLTLHADVKAQLHTVPESQRVMVTAHDAFHYFGRAYGIEVRGIQGISTEIEAGVREVNDLVTYLVERKIKAVFVESSVSERNVRALVEGCRSRGHDLRIGGELFSDAPGNEGTPEGTYPGMIRHNVRTIVEALR